MSEWRELPKGDIVAFAEAVKAGGEIEINDGRGWEKWGGLVWLSDWSIRVRSTKTRQVQLRGFLTSDGNIVIFGEGGMSHTHAVTSKWPRVPSKDEIVEVKE